MKNNHLIPPILLLRPHPSPKTSHLITGSRSRRARLARMIKGQACHLVSRPSLRGRQKRGREWSGETRWHTGLMKAMNHTVVFKEHISGIINSAQRPEPGWADRSLHQPPAAPTPATRRPAHCLSYSPKPRSLGSHPHGPYFPWSRLKGAYCYFLDTITRINHFVWSIWECLVTYLNKNIYHKKLM